MTFTATLATADGWSERRQIAIALVGGRVSAAAGGSTLVLADSAAALGFDYLLEPGANAKWVHDWTSPVSAPLAVRVWVARRAGPGDSLRADTTLYLVKERG